MIAYDNRATQEVTPTATIISLALACVSVMDLVITLVVAGFIERYIQVDWARRLLPVAILIVALVLVIPLELAERRKVRSKVEQFIPVETVTTDNYVTFVRTTRDTGFESELFTRQSDLNFHSVMSPRWSKEPRITNSLGSNDAVIRSQLGGDRRGGLLGQYPD